MTSIHRKKIRVAVDDNVVGLRMKHRRRNSDLIVSGDEALVKTRQTIECARVRIESMVTACEIRQRDHRVDVGLTLLAHQQFNFSLPQNPNNLIVLRNLFRN